MYTANEEQSQKLTDGQKRAMVEIKSIKGGYLRPHMTGSGAKCYRLMTATHSPERNYPGAVIEGLLMARQLKRKGIFLYTV